MSDPRRPDENTPPQGVAHALIGRVDKQDRSLSEPTPTGAPNECVGPGTGQVERTKQVGDGDYLSSCPVDGHGRGRGDQNPSLHVTWDGDKVLLHCAGGCHPQDVLIAMGMDWPDLWDEPVTNHRGQLAASWTYTQRDGTPYFVVERWQGPQGKFFRQRLPEATTAGLGSGFKPCLLNMPKVFDAIHHGEEVWVVEGEKCVSAAERLGLVATTAPMGINGWKDYYAKWFTEGEGAKCVNVVVDNDEAGHRYGAAVAVCLRGVGIKVKTWRVATTGEKDDLYDHVLAGLGVADLVPIRLNRLRPEGLTLRQLMTNKYPAIKWAIDGILPAGLALLGGPPKSSKSMIALEMSLGIAHGQSALSRLRCNLGSVLYLSLDNDAARRLQSRVRYLMPMGLDIETPIEFHTEWPTGDAAIQGCQEWLDDEREEGRNPLLVVVDTLGKAEPNFEGNGFENSYLGVHRHPVEVVEVRHRQRRGRAGGAPRPQERRRGLAEPLHRVAGDHRDRADADDVGVETRRGDGVPADRGPGHRDR